MEKLDIAILHLEGVLEGLRLARRILSANTDASMEVNDYLDQLHGGYMPGGIRVEPADGALEQLGFMVSPDLLPQKPPSAFVQTGGEEGVCATTCPEEGSSPPTILSGKAKQRKADVLPVGGVNPEVDHNSSVSLLSDDEMKTGPLRLAIAKCLTAMGPLTAKELDKLIKTTKHSLYRIQTVTKDHPWFDMEGNKIHITPIGIAVVRGETIATRRDS